MGFWFEPVAFFSSRLGQLTPVDLAAIGRIATDEIRRAFAGLPITISDNRHARFRVRVVQAINHPLFRRRSASPAPLAL